MVPSGTVEEERGPSLPQEGRGAQCPARGDSEGLQLEHLKTKDFPCNALAFRVVVSTWQM